MKISRLNSKDLRICRELLMESLKTEFSLDFNTSRVLCNNFSSSAFESTFNLKAYNDLAEGALGAYEDGVLAGFLIGSIVPEDKETLLVDFLYVAPQFRGSNISYKLILQFLNSYEFKNDSRVLFKYIQNDFLQTFYKNLDMVPVNLIHNISTNSPSMVSFYQGNICRIIDLISHSFHSDMLNCPYCGFPLKEGVIETYNHALHWHPTEKRQKETLSIFEKIRTGFSVPSSTECISKNFKIITYKCERCSKLIIDLIENQISNS